MSLSASKLLLICSFIFFLSQQLSASIAPQAGESVWAIIQKIGQHLDEGKDFAETWTAIHAVEYSDPLYTPIQNEGGTITIESPGNYKMVESLSYPVVINSDNVTLDLNNYTIALSAGSAITIIEGNKNITIQNGWLAPGNGTGDNGIEIFNSVITSEIYINNIKINGGYMGIYCESRGTGEIRGCYITDCHCIGQSHIGFCLTAQDNSEIYECSISNCIASGVKSGITLACEDSGYLYLCNINHCKVFNANDYAFYFYNSSSDTNLHTCSIHNCIAYNRGGSGIYGFYCRNTSNILFQNCIAMGLYLHNFYIDSLNFYVQCIKIENGVFAWIHTVGATP